MRTITSRYAIAALTVVLGLAVASSASAQFNYTCIVVNGVKVLVISDRNVASGSTGSGTFVANPPIAPQGPINSTLTATNVTVTSNDPAVGTITTTLDASRDAQTTITSNGADRFPATGIIQFYATATISSKPGTYSSDTPLELVNENLQSVNPFRNETFTLRNDVTFTNDDGTSFTLKAGETTVTLGSDTPPDGDGGLN